jgi:stage II sporulation protein E
MAGVFKGLGKLGSIIGFILGNILITIYSNGSTEVLINIKDIAGGALIASLIPLYVISNINNYFVTPYISSFQQKKSSERLKEATKKRITGVSESFELLAETFNKICDQNININKEDVSTLFDEVAERTCKTCLYNTTCWNKNFYSTYQAMFGILEKLEEKGRIDKYEVPEYFKDKCVKLDQFINNSNFMFELYSQNLLWRKKMGENRLLIAQQLEGASKVMYELAEDINEGINFKTEIEKQIYVELIKNNLNVDEVAVIENKNERLEVSISHKPCENKRLCNTSITPLVSKILRRRMTKESASCDINQDKNICVITLTEQPKYRIVTGTSMLAKNNDNICGDNNKVITLKDGKAVMVLSDGMGTGKKASKQSDTAISLLEKLIKSGFEKYLSIKLINSALVLNSIQDSFTSMDLTILDLFTGEAEFAKVGAVTTFIKRPHKIEVVRSTSLPVGILDNVDVELTKKKLEDEDIIVMVSDGVLDSKKDSVKKEDWIIEKLEKTAINNPQDLAEYLINVAKENNKGVLEDDMTVVVTKIIERL